LRREFDKLRPAIGRVVEVRDEPICREGVGQALHALPGELPVAGDLRHGPRLVLGCGENAPARSRLAERRRDRVTGPSEQALELEDANDERAECVALGAARLDSILSFLYHVDSILSVGEERK